MSDEERRGQGEGYGGETYVFIESGGLGSWGVGSDERGVVAEWAWECLFPCLFRRTREMGLGGYRLGAVVQRACHGRQQQRQQLRVRVTEMRERPGGATRCGSQQQQAAARRPRRAVRGPVITWDRASGLCRAVQRRAALPLLDEC
jgi:hypothetical protein